MWYILSYHVPFPLDNRSWKLFHVSTYSAALFFQFSADAFVGWMCHGLLRCSGGRPRPCTCTPYTCAGVFLSVAP